MKVIMVMYDSLNRRMLPPYGCDWVKAPNFARLAEKTVVFDNSYVGSLPCMPARRELHTGRYNFLHRSWGPVEPFDDSMPAILRDKGVYTHLVTDHYHYWQEGGCTYHTRYNSFEISRGQEGDAWKGDLHDPEAPKEIAGSQRRQDWVNRMHMSEIEDQPQHKTFSMGLDFIKRNHDRDNWFLHIETFDPHEPYFSHKKYKELYPHDYNGPHFDWPTYKKVNEPSDQVQHCRYESAALHSMCDEYLGKVLDLMDSHDLWKDTMLIVNTDHGFLLGEHGWWAKCVQPFYNEVAHTPFFIWDPRSGACGERRDSLVQTIDIAPTVLEYFGVDIPPDMEGKALRETVASDEPVREAGLFGLFGAQGGVSVTDGRYVYMRGPKDDKNAPLYEYTHMPTHMVHPFSVEELRNTGIGGPFSFTKGCPVMKIDASGPVHGKLMKPEEDERMQTMLFDLENDPKQENPIDDPEVEKMMIRHLVRLMKANDAPPEQFERLGLKGDEDAS